MAPVPWMARVPSSYSFQVRLPPFAPQFPLPETVISWVSVCCALFAQTRIFTILKCAASHTGSPQSPQAWLPSQEMPLASAQTYAASVQFTAWMTRESLHSEKAKSPILVTLLGIVTLSRLEQE